jgi:NADPH:quinone reductase-like Zn-dependent oxidoreductase
MSMMPVAAVERSRPSSREPEGQIGRLVAGRSMRAPLVSMCVRPRLKMLVSNEGHADLAPLTDLIEAGKLTPSIDAMYPLDEAQEAMRRLEAGTVRGKVCIGVSPGPCETGS